MLWVRVPQEVQNMNNKKSKYKINDNLYRCECGKEFNNSQSLNAHFSHCNIHHALRGTVRKDFHKGTLYWENKTEEEIKSIHEKSRRTLIERLSSGEINPAFLGKHHTEENKDKIRISSSKIHKIINTGPLYNRKSIAYIDQLNRQNNWKLQHAENGGEICISGYYLDGYDKELNIAFEYDEPKHYKDKKNNILKEYDIKRMKRIHDVTGCIFYRYNEYLNLFYRFEL